MRCLFLVLLLVGVAPSSGTASGDARLDQLVAGDAVAEVEILRREKVNTPRLSLLLQLRVVRQAGLVLLPQRIHLLIPEQDWKNRKMAPPWFVQGNTEIGAKRIVPVFRRTGELPWQLHEQIALEHTNWQSIERVYRRRKELQHCSDEKRVGRLIELFQSDAEADRCAAYTWFRFERENPSQEAIACCAALNFHDLPSEWNNLYQGRLYYAFVRAWETKSVGELKQIWNEPITDRTIWAHHTAETALGNKGARGEQAAIEFWLEEAQAWPRSRVSDHMLFHALGKHLSRPGILARFITNFEQCEPKDRKGVQWLALIAAGGEKGFDYVADCLTGIRNPQAARDFQREGLLWFWEYNNRELANSAAGPRAMKLLEQKRPQIRAFAAHQLGLIQHDAAAPLLLRHLLDQHETDQVRVSSALALLAMKDATVLRFAPSLLDSKQTLVFKRIKRFHNDAQSDYHMKGLVFQRLGKINTPEVTVLLRKYLKNSEYGDSWTWNALACQRSVETTRFFTEQYVIGEKQNPQLARSAIQALLGQNSAEATRCLRRLAFTADKEARQLIWDHALTDERLTADLVDDYRDRLRLARKTVDVTMVEARIKELDSEDFSTRERAFKQLHCLGLAALPELRRTVDYGSMEQVSRCRRLLEQLPEGSLDSHLAQALLKYNNKRYLPLQRELLQSADPVVRVMALEGLQLLVQESINIDPLAPGAARWRELDRWKTQLDRLVNQAR